MDDASLFITIGVFVLFVIMALYYFMVKKANDQGLILLIFGLIFLGASFTDLLDFVLPILFFVFFVSIFTQYLRKRQMHQLLWSISLFMFFITTFFQALATILGTWDPTMLRTYYVFQSFQVMLLGLGELFLLSKRNVITRNVNIAVILISGLFWMIFGFVIGKTSPEAVMLIALPAMVVLLYGVLDIVFALLKANKYQLTGYQYSNFALIFSIYTFILAVYYTFTIPFLSGSSLIATGGVEAVIKNVWGDSSTVRGFTPLFAVNGGMFIFLGSVYSYIIWQISIKKNQGKFSFGTGIFNIYFAIGVAIFTVGGSLAQNTGVAVLYISELLGGIFMYFGFLESDKISMELIMDIVTLRFLHKHYEQSQMLSH